MEDLKQLNIKFDQLVETRRELYNQNQELKQEHLAEALAIVELQNEQLDEDLTVVGHKFYDAPDGPCFCHSPNSKTCNSVTTKQSFEFPSHQIPLLPMNTDHRASTSDIDNQCYQNNEKKFDDIDTNADTDNEDEDDDDTYSCSSVSSRSSRDPRCPRCFIIANTDCSKAVYV